MTARNEKEQDQLTAFYQDNRHSFYSAALTAILIAGAIILTGRVSPYEARTLLASVMPSLRFLTSTVMTVSSTILALMLTLISITSSIEHKLKGTFYKLMRLAAFMSIICVVFATVLLTVGSVPIEESDGVPVGWYKTIYYTTISLSSILSGALVSVVFMLYYAVRNMIAIFDPTTEDSSIMIIEPQQHK